MDIILLRILAKISRLFVVIDRRAIRIYMLQIVSKLVSFLMIGSKKKKKSSNNNNDGFN